MSVCSVANSLNLTVCSYRDPRLGKSEDDEDAIVEKRAHIYLGQALMGSDNAHIISKLRESNYAIFPNLPEAATFIAYDPIRFKQIKAIRRNSADITSICMIDSLTGVAVNASSAYTPQLGRLALLHGRTALEADLHVAAASEPELQLFGEDCEKFLQPLDLGNLLIQTPIEGFPDNLRRIFNSMSKYDRIERVHYDEFLPATFCVIHCKEQKSLVSAVAARITNFVASAKHPIMVKTRTLISRVYAVAKALLAKPVGKGALIGIAGFLLWNAPAIITSLGLNLMHPVFTVPARTWIVYTALTNKNASFKNVLVVAALGVLLFSLNAPIYLTIVCAYLCMFTVASVREKFNLYPIHSPIHDRRFRQKMLLVGIVAGIALSEAIYYFADGEFRRTIDSSSFTGVKNTLISLYNL